MSAEGDARITAPQQYILVCLLVVNMFSPFYDEIVRLINRSIRADP
jgi:hypothetical protein